MKNNLRQIMEERGITVRKLSEMTRDERGNCVSTKTITEVRMGRNCELRTIQRIAAALGVDVEILFDGSVDKNY
ncbi:MAG: helix-turn-helix transcriptional regulator [Desulfobacterales bacterium]